MPLEYSPDHPSCPFAPWSSSGSIVVSSGVKVLVWVLPVGRPHIPVCSPHVSRSCTQSRTVNIRKCNYDLIHSDKCLKKRSSGWPWAACPGNLYHWAFASTRRTRTIAARSNFMAGDVWKVSKTVVYICLSLEMIQKGIGKYIILTIYSRWKSRFQLTEVVQSWSLVVILGRAGLSYILGVVAIKGAGCRVSKTLWGVSCLMQLNVLRRMMHAEALSSVFHPNPDAILCLILPFQVKNKWENDHMIENRQIQY